MGNNIGINKPEWNPKDNTEIMQGIKSKEELANEYASKKAINGVDAKIVRKDFIAGYDAAFEQQGITKEAEEIKVWQIHHPARKIFDDICWNKFGQTFDDLCGNEANQQSGFWLSLILPAMIQYATTQSQTEQKTLAEFLKSNPEALEQALEMWDAASEFNSTIGIIDPAKIQYFKEKFNLDI